MPISSCIAGSSARCDLGKDGLSSSVTVAALAEIGARISAAERRAMAAERDTVDRLIAAHLADEIGAVFDARINGVTRAGLFVSLTETGASGFIPAATLGGEYFRFKQAEHALVGERSGASFRLGDSGQRASRRGGTGRRGFALRDAFRRHAHASPPARAANREPTLRACGRKDERRGVRHAAPPSSIGASPPPFILDAYSLHDV